MIYIYDWINAEIKAHRPLGFTLTSVTNLHQVYFITNDGICYSLLLFFFFFCYSLLYIQILFIYRVQEEEINMVQISYAQKTIWSYPKISPLHNCLVTKSCPTPCNPIDSSPPGSSNHGISSSCLGFPRQEYWSGLHFFLQRIFPTHRLNSCLLLGRWILYHWATWEPHFVIIDLNRNTDGRF